MHNESDPSRHSVESDSVAGDDVSILEVLMVLANRRRIIFRLMVSGLTIGILLSLLLPDRYTAVTTILPPQQNASAGSALLAQLGSSSSIASAAQGSLGIKNPNDLQVAMLQSRTVEDAMVDRFNLMKYYGKKRRSDARKKLEHFVSIENGVKDGLIRVAVTARTPEEARDMANGYVEEFKRSSARLAITEASRRRIFFEGQLSGAKDNLASAEEELKKVSQQNGVVELDSQANALIASAAQLRAQIAAKEVEIQGIRSFATGENADLQFAQQELAALKTQLERTGATSDQLFIPRGRLQQSGLDYVRKARDVKYFQTIFDLLARQYEVAKVDEARQDVGVQIVDLAVAPDRRSSPKPLYLIPGCTLLGLLLGMGLAFFGWIASRIASNPAEQPRLEALKRAFSSESKAGIRM